MPGATGDAANRESYASLRLVGAFKVGGFFVCGMDEANGMPQPARPETGTERMQMCSGGQAR